MEDTIAQVRALDQATVNVLARRATGNDTIEVNNWDARPLAHNVLIPITGGLYRVVGTGHDHDTMIEWSLILKVVLAAGGSDDPTHIYYWKREPFAYQSGLLSDLPGGLAAPRCFGVLDRPGAAWIWLEEIIETGCEIWPFDRYGLAARHIGQFGGTYLKGQSLPTYRHGSQRPEIGPPAP